MLVNALDGLPIDLGLQIQQVIDSSAAVEPRQTGRGFPGDENVPCVGREGAGGRVFDMIVAEVARVRHEEALRGGDEIKILGDHFLARHQDRVNPGRIDGPESADHAIIIASHQRPARHRRTILGRVGRDDAARLEIGGVRAVVEATDERGFAARRGLPDPAGRRGDDQVALKPAHSGSLVNVEAPHRPGLTRKRDPRQLHGTVGLDAPDLAGRRRPEEDLTRRKPVQGLAGASEFDFLGDADGVRQRDHVAVRFQTDQVVWLARGIVHRNDKVAHVRVVGQAYGDLVDPQRDQIQRQ
jgi:hypothetical protein